MLKISLTSSKSQPDGLVNGVDNEVAGETGNNSGNELIKNFQSSKSTRYMEELSFRDPNSQPNSDFDFRFRTYLSILQR